MANTSRAAFGFCRFGLVFALVIQLLTNLAVAKDDATNTIAQADAKPAADTATNQDAMRAYLQIQDQLHNTLLAIEKSRQASEAAASNNAALVDARLSKMEKAVATQRIDELRDMERSDRTILIAAGAFAGVGFLVLFVAAFLQWAAVNRLATATARLPAGPFLPSLGDAHSVPNAALEQSTTKFLSMIERLEQRIHDMEATSNSRAQLPGPASTNGGPKHLTSGTETADSVAPEKSSAVNVLLGKGQTLLKLDKAEDALSCLDEALAQEPGNTEVLLKKGAALERLQRFTEAIDCYDRVIAKDNTMTMAYLYKGAVFNRMERYSEALECYEQALKTRQKGEAANVIFE